MVATLRLGRKNCFRITSMKHTPIASCSEAHMGSTEAAVG